MDLRAYRAKYGRSALPKLAERAGIHSSRLYEIVRGHVPTAAIAKKIEAASDGEVSAIEVLGLAIPSTVATIDESATAGHSRTSDSDVPSAAE